MSRAVWATEPSWKEGDDKFNVKITNGNHLHASDEGKEANSGVAAGRRLEVHGRRAVV